MRALPVTSGMIDGEGVVCDGRGVTDFERLRSALARDSSRQAFLFAFDVLEIDGRDMRARPWHERRTALPSSSGNAAPFDYQNISTAQVAPPCSGMPAQWA